MMKTKKLLILVPMFLLAFSFSAACGGDDDGGEIKTGSEEEYVESMCDLQHELLEDMFGTALKLGQDASDDETADVFKGPVKEMRDADAQGSTAR